MYCYMQCMDSYITLEERAGERMKLATAYTWETELSRLGNVPEAWEDLIKSRKAGLKNQLYFSFW